MADADTGSGNSAKQTAKDLFAGAAGGIAQVLIGQPFDIVKVRLQTTTNYPNALTCATRIYQQEGPLAFYKGTLTPLIGIGACVSVQFGGFHTVRRFFESQNATSKTTSTTTASTNPLQPQPLSYSQYYAAGAIAGVTNSVLSGPIEHVRIRLQTQPHGINPPLYAGPLSCIRTLVSRSGVARGLYRGQIATVWREAQAYGCWFLTYEWLMNSDVARRRARLGEGQPGTQRSDVEAWKLALYGGVAGEMLWLSSYPFDVVKSKMQTDGLGFAAKMADATTATAVPTSGGAGAAASVPDVGGAGFSKAPQHTATATSAAPPASSSASAKAAAAATSSEAGGSGFTKTPKGTVSADTATAQKAASEAKYLGHQRYTSTTDCVRQTWAAEGFRGFWKGIGPTLLRAMPVSAATFAV
ncbi:MAG: hypothetical protein M1831_005218 [Alyxoria varia]|nr:MAG: hypothetical protein M1831_005218 [Alyxoria varia]